MDTINVFFRGGDKAVPPSPFSWCLTLVIIIFHEHVFRLSNEAGAEHNSPLDEIAQRASKCSTTLENIQASKLRSTSQKSRGKKLRKKELVPFAGTRMPFFQVF